MKNLSSTFRLVQLQDQVDLRKIHLDLNQYYHTLFFGSLQAHGDIDDRRSALRRLETVWIGKEKQECLKKYNCGLDVLDEAIVHLALRNHGVANHPLFDYLCYEADLSALKSFVHNESILNFEFFDYLVLAILGASDSAKAEIITNLWDEAGRGDIQKFHTNLFGYLMKDLGLTYQRDQIINSLPWEALAGINLFSYCSLYSYNKMMYFGLLAATEMLDPPHYQKLIQGMKRIFAHQKMNISYYVEHESIDVEHASGWLKKVILPELAKNPTKTQDFWLGFYLRLNSAKRYYDNLYTQLRSAKAA